MKDNLHVLQTENISVSLLHFFVWSQRGLKEERRQTYRYFKSCAGAYGQAGRTNFSRKEKITFNEKNNQKNIAYDTVAGNGSFITAYNSIRGNE